MSNCQILQTRANRGKSNIVSFSQNDLRLWSCANAYTGVAILEDAPLFVFPYVSLQRPKWTLWRPWCMAT